MRQTSVREGYAAWAPNYDEFVNPMTTVAERLVRACTLRLEGMRVCEIGCGTGRNAELLWHQNARYTGVDSSPEMLAKARAKLAETPGARYIEADLMDDRWLRAGPFDLILGCLVLEHIEDLDPVFDRLHRASGQGAALWLIELHADRHQAGIRAHVHTAHGALCLPSYAHSCDDYARALLSSGWAIQSIQDVYASDADEQRCEKLKRYRGLPLLTEVWATRA